MIVFPDTQPVEPPALPEWAPPELFPLESSTPALLHTYGDGLYGTGTYGDFLPALAPSFVPALIAKPPEFLPLADPVAQSPGVLLPKPPELILLPEVRP